MRSGSRYDALRRWVIRTFDTCTECGKPVDKTLPGTHPQGPTLGHRRALVEGGSLLDRTNAGLEHLGCNSAKENRRRARARQALVDTPTPSRRW